MSISDGSNSSIFRRTIERTHPMKKNGWEGVYFPPELAFRLWCLLIKVLLICTLAWRVNKYVFRQGKVIRNRNESTKLVTFCPDDFKQSPFLFSYDTVLTNIQVDLSIKFNSVFNTVSFFPLLKMATLRNKRKLAAINREDHEKDLRNWQAGAASVPRLQEGYIT